MSAEDTFTREFLIMDIEREREIGRYIEIQPEHSSLVCSDD